MKPRDVLCWKFVFYEAFLPALRRLGPARATRSSAAWAGWPPRSGPRGGGSSRAALARAPGRRFGPTGPSEALRPALAANTMRFLARDYPLDDARRRRGPGPVRRRGVRAPPRRAGARPGGDPRRQPPGGPHRGAALALSPGGAAPAAGPAAQARLARAEPPVRRGRARTRSRASSSAATCSPGQAVERLLRARAAPARRPGDLPQRRHPLAGPNTGPGRLLGQPQPFLAVWADLAVLTRAPVFLVFCTHRAGGRFALTIDPPLDPRPRARSRRPSPPTSPASKPRSPPIPADAVAHLLWPCYGPPAPAASHRVAPRPSRRVAAVAQP